MPIEPDKPSLSSHPLTWTTISHVIWDGYSPDVTVGLAAAGDARLAALGRAIDRSLAGRGQSFSLLRDSFLGPYLPGEATGETVPLSEDDLQPLSQSYPPPALQLGRSTIRASRFRRPAEDPAPRGSSQYQAPVPIRPAPKRPVYLSVLKAKPGASTIPLGEASPHVLAVERRVGRGRITMLAINPNEEALLAWPGLDTLVRRVVLRRPEEPSQ